MRQEAVDRIRRNQQKQEQGAGGFFKSDLKDVHFWKCTEGDHKIDIIPYFAGANDPLVVKGEMKEGDEQYVLEFFVHGNDVGIGDFGIMCLQATYNRPCPICEDYRRRLKAGEDDKVLKYLKPKWNPRSVYNIIDIDNENKGIQVFHTSHYLLETELLEQAKVPVRPGQSGIDPIIVFYDPEIGKSIAFKRVGTGANTQFNGVRFFDRPPGFKVDQRDLDDAYCLDELLYIPTYEDVRKFYYGADEPSNETASRGRGRGADSQPAETSSRGRGRNTETDVPADIGTEGTSSRSERRSRRGSEEQQPQIETREEGSRGRGREGRSRGDGDGQGRQEASSNPCPAGHTFAADIDKYPDDCEPCGSYRLCARSARELTAGGAASRGQDESAKEQAPSGETRQRRRA